ncbi:MAG: o-succinylbenzoate synthase [Flammeovirgaceae bacterium]
MPLCASVHPYTLQFNFEARTSRGSMKERKCWFLKLWNSEQPEVFGLGECAPLPGLSKETLEEAEGELTMWAGRANGLIWTITGGGLPEVHSFLNSQHLQPFCSSVSFAVEAAMLDLLQGGKRIIFQTDFVRGNAIDINGLIWMGGLDYMLQQIDIKIRDGFQCIKMKVGSHNFEKECDILQYVRRKYFKQHIVIRLDANGAFKDDALDKLRALARFDVHSIEQPVKAGSDKMEMLCRESPVPVALDEELIGVPPNEREALLTKLKPKHIILKPSLMGGLLANKEWIALAEKLGIGWWMTSALESNVGLNAIAQFTSQYALTLPQGLGTGSLYTNNIESPLQVAAGKLSHNIQKHWDLRELFPPANPDDPAFLPE